MTRFLFLTLCRPTDLPGLCSHLLARNYSALPGGDVATLLGADITTGHLGTHSTFVTGGITGNVARVKRRSR